MRLALGGLLLAGTIAGARLAQARHMPEAPVHIITLPAGRPVRWVNNLVDEQDLLLFGEAVLRGLGGVSQREHAGLEAAATAAYARLRAEQGAFASPVAGTYLFLQRPGAFDAVVVEPDGSRPPQAGLVLLHGFTGNVTLQCWHVAEAARSLGMVTVCPSTGWIGDWWRPPGEATLQATLRYLEARGIQRVYVGGFSNGGLGLSRLALTAAQAPGVRGLVFIAGVSHARDLRATGLPVLII